MKRYILFLLIAVCSLGVNAQSRMTDNQVMEFIIKEHKKGTSQAQIVTKLMQSGVDITQIRRVKNTYERMQKGTGLGTKEDAVVTSSDDRSRKNNVDDEAEKVSNYSNYRVARNRDEYAGTYDENDAEIWICIGRWMTGCLLIRPRCTSSCCRNWKKTRRKCSAETSSTRRISRLNPI